MTPRPPLSQPATKPATPEPPQNAALGGGQARAGGAAPGAGQAPAGDAAQGAGQGVGQSAAQGAGQGADQAHSAHSADAARAALAERQGRVVAALVAGGEPPAGFDPERMRVQAHSLLAKRRAIVAKLRPDAAEAAGPDLAAEFAAYARARTEPPPNYRTDADDFAAWLRGRGRTFPEDERRRPWWSRLPGLRGRAL